MSPKLKAEMREQNHLNGWGARAADVVYEGISDLDFGTSAIDYVSLDCIQFRTNS